MAGVIGGKIFFANRVVFSAISAASKIIGNLLHPLCWLNSAKDCGGTLGHGARAAPHALRVEDQPARSLS
jgi:hypothetical protein